jgi:hypothetical protein
MGRRNVGGEVSVEVSELRRRRRRGGRRRTIRGWDRSAVAQLERRSARV